MVSPVAALLVGMASLAVVLFVFWPRQGLVARVQRLRSVTGRVRREDAMKHIFVASSNGQGVTLQSLAGVIAPAAGGLLLQGVGSWSLGLVSAAIMAWLATFVWRYLIKQQGPLQRMQEPVEGE